MVTPPDNMALLRLASRAAKKYDPVVKGAKDIRNMVSKFKADLTFKDVNKLRQGRESTYFLEKKTHHTHLLLLA